MTRINTIPVEKLTDQWLMAEYREITHVFPLVESAESKWSHSDIVKKISANYTFNKGHVSFFYDKLAFIESRYFEISNELLRRGYNLNIKDEKVLGFRERISSKYYNNWEPSADDHRTNVGRLIERFNLKPEWYIDLKELNAIVNI